MSAPSEEESESEYLQWQITQQPFFVLTAQYQIGIQRFQRFLTLLFFNLLLSLPYLLSNKLEEHFHINIVSQERFKQLRSQNLDLIANDCHLLGQSLIYFSDLNFDIIPYLVF